MKINLKIENVQISDHELLEILSEKMQIGEDWFVEGDKVYSDPGYNRSPEEVTPWEAERFLLFNQVKNFLRDEEIKREQRNHDSLKDRILKEIRESEKAEAQKKRYYSKERY